MDIVGIRDARERVMIMERNLAFESDPEAFRTQWLPKEVQEGLDLFGYLVGFLIFSIIS